MSGDAAIWLKGWRDYGSTQDAGASPLFPPVHAPTEVDVALAQLTETLHQSPENFGLARSRWWLAGIGQAVPWLKEVSVPGIWQVLDRFDLAYKRGRRYVHSPDPDYQAKSARLRCAWQEVEEDPVRFVLLYQDELTSYRCPTTASTYAQRGSDGPRADQGSGYNSKRRIAGCLDAASGRLICWQRSAFDHRTFLRYLQAVEACYPRAERISIALDNWPVHFQPDVLAALASSKITLLFLPTYAPWLNPIEKVWRKLKQEVLHLHRSSSRWKDLQERVEQWLIQYDRPSPDLLHYVGLLPD
jgi:transposase